MRQQLLTPLKIKSDLLYKAFYNRYLIIGVAPPQNLDRGKMMFIFN